MAKSSFDKLYSTLPPLDRDEGFFRFWKGAIADVKAISMKSETTKKSENKLFKVFNVKFTSYGRSISHGELHVPINTKNPKVILHIGDYNNKTDFRPYFIEEFAHFVMKLKGESNFITNEKEDTPGFFSQNILDLDAYYPKSIYIDLLRSVDLLRLVKGINCNSIGINAIGFGTAAAVFVASFSERIKAIALNSPSFTYLAKSQNSSSNALTKEINDAITKTKGKKTAIKKNLTYFDSLNFADKIKCETLMVVGFKDNQSPPESSFALFNNILSEKTMHGYPEEGFNPGGKKQAKETIKWLSEII